MAGVATVVVLVLCAGMGSTSVAGASTLGGSTPGATGATAAEVRDPASLVDPFIGTTNGGDTFPGADVPFGMVQWSPDTVYRPDGGRLRIPQQVDHRLQPDPSVRSGLCRPKVMSRSFPPSVPSEATRWPPPSRWIHSDESASPGYYQLDAGGIDTQLTTTTRSGMAAFTFPSGTPVGNLLFKLADSENIGDIQSTSTS